MFATALALGDRQNRRFGGAVGGAPTSSKGSKRSMQTAQQRLSRPVTRAEADQPDQRRHR
jgi:hypothetical protein